MRACHEPGQPSQTILRGYLGVYATPRSAKEVMDRQHYSVDGQHQAGTGTGGGGGGGRKREDSTADTARKRPRDRKPPPEQWKC